MLDYLALNIALNPDGKILTVLRYAVLIICFKDPNDIGVIPVCPYSRLGEILCEIVSWPEYLMLFRRGPMVFVFFFFVRFFIVSRYKTCQA